MTELEKALARREAFQNTFQFVMITGTLLVAARDADENAANELERAMRSLRAEVL